MERRILRPRIFAKSPKKVIAKDFRASESPLAPAYNSAVLKLCCDVRGCVTDADGRRSYQCDKAVRSSPARLFVDSKVYKVCWFNSANFIQAASRASSWGLHCSHKR